MHPLKLRSASAEPHDTAITGEQRIAQSDASITERLRKMLDKLVDLRSAFFNDDASIMRMQCELDQLQRENANLTTQLEELSRKHVETHHDAFHDELTGLPNRKRLRDRFNVATGFCERRHQQVVLLFLDLDDFKRINDDFGHSVGDKVLQIVATRLQASVRATDTACRYGGDEFVVLLSDIDAAKNAADIAKKICDRLAARYQIGDTDIDLNASIGIAIYPDDCQNWEDLVQHADAAMYHSRAQRRQNNPVAIAEASET